MQIKKVRVVTKAEELPELVGLKVEVTERTQRYSSGDYVVIEAIRLEDAQGNWITVAAGGSGTSIQITAAKQETVEAKIDKAIDAVDEVVAAELGVGGNA